MAERYGVPVDRAGAAYASWRCCAAIRPTAYPACPVSAKTAATMLTQYGSLAAVPAAAHDPKSQLPKAFRAKILAATDYIEAAGPVVRVARDAPVSLSGTDRLPLHAADPKRVAELAAAYGIGSPVTRLQKALDTL